MKLQHVSFFLQVLSFIAIITACTFSVFAQRAQRQINDISIGRFAYQDKRIAELEKRITQLEARQ
jgi:hypothetical protein